MIEQELFTQMNLRDLHILRSFFLDNHDKAVNHDTPLNQISNINFDYNWQLFYDFETTPAINTETPHNHLYTTFDDDDDEMDGNDSDEAYTADEVLEHE